LLIVSLGRRQILWLGVTAHPTAEWIANPLTEACGWERLPRYLIVGDSLNGLTDAMRRQTRADHGSDAKLNCFLIEDSALDYNLAIGGPHHS
jgi:hypothetical protein